MGALLDFYKKQLESAEATAAKQAQNRLRVAEEAESLEGDIEALSRQFGKQCPAQMTGSRVMVSDASGKELVIDISLDADPADPGFTYLVNDGTKQTTYTGDTFYAYIVNWLRGAR